MLEGSIEGQKANYLFGYFPKEEPVPVGWVKTLRPCMECNSEYTFIDSKKVWHCIRCGWRSDEVNKRWRAEDVAFVKEKYGSGMKIREIADQLNMGYQTVYMKIYQMKKAGEIEEPVAVDSQDSANIGIGNPQHVPPAPPTPAERLSKALVDAEMVGLSITSVCVNESSATLVFTLNLG